MILVGPIWEVVASIATDAFILLMPCLAIAVVGFPIVLFAIKDDNREDNLGRYMFAAVASCLPVGFASLMAALWVAGLWGGYPG